MAENNEKINRRLNGTMTLGDLVAKVKEWENEFDLESKIAFSSDYGDHCHTEQVHLLQGELIESRVYTSAYSGSGLAIKDDEDEEGYEELPIVLLLK